MVRSSVAWQVGLSVLGAITLTAVTTAAAARSTAAPRARRSELAVTIAARRTVLDADQPARLTVRLTNTGERRVSVDWLCTCGGPDRKSGDRPFRFHIRQGSFRRAVEAYDQDPTSERCRRCEPVTIELDPGESREFKWRLDLQEATGRSGRFEVWAVNRSTGVRSNTLVIETAGGE